MAIVAVTMKVVGVDTKKEGKRRKIILIMHCNLCTFMVKLIYGFLKGNSAMGF